jgi:hypothetical protein
MLPLYATAVRRNVFLLERIDSTNDKVRICFRNPRNQTNAEPSYVPATRFTISTSRGTFWSSPSMTTRRTTTEFRSTTSTACGTPRKLAQIGSCASSATSAATGAAPITRTRATR